MTLAHPKRSIKNHAIMFWNATFAHAEVLNYPENLRYSEIVKSRPVRINVMVKAMAMVCTLVLRLVVVMTTMKIMIFIVTELVLVR